MLARSKRLTLTPSSSDGEVNQDENIAAYFKMMESKGLNPRLPEYRQAFNNRVLDRSGYRYLVSAYAEDRRLTLKGSSIARQGRTVHLGIDIFSKDLEPVMAPCDGLIVRTGREEEAHSFGNYVILKPDAPELPLLFFGHLANELPPRGHVKKGQVIATLGDYANNENGGWSRHLHLQCLKELPAEGCAPIGYGSASDFPNLHKLYPNPMELFRGWKPM